MAIVLLQEPNGGARSAAGARFVHSTDEAEEHASSPDGRRPDYAPRPGVLRVRLGRLGAVTLLGLSLAGCGSAPEGTRLWSDTYEFRVTVDPKPPRALEPALYRVVVIDKKTKQPIETGEGRIFATSADRASTNDGFKKEKEDRKSTRLNSSHSQISYAVFCLKK